MNQRDRVVKAVNLLRPVASAVAVRRPAGMSNAAADTITQNLRRALEALEDTSEIYDRTAERRQS